LAISPISAAEDFSSFFNHIMQTGQLSDEVLAARVAQSDLTAFETLYDRHASMVLGISLRITGERAAAEDIVQETFWRLWQSADTYQPERGPFTGWLFRIARNLAIDAYRRSSNRPNAVANETDAEPILDQIPDLDMNVPEQAWSNLISQQARNALKTLPQEQRQVIELAYFSGMTRQEVAEATGQRPGNIQTRARLGMQKLREALERAEFEF
jgi:RNA polymerase sigma-70 factor, ECF subfamily